MNPDKTIEELSKRLDVIDPYSSFSTWNEIRHDGINYWKGKKIISAKKWNEIYEKNSTYTDNYRITLVSNKPLQYFPDDYNGSISSSDIPAGKHVINLKVLDLLAGNEGPPPKFEPLRTGSYEILVK